MSMSIILSMLFSQKKYNRCNTKLMFAGRRELRFTFHYIKHIFSESKVSCYPKHLKYKPEEKKQSRDAIYIIYIYIYIGSLQVDFRLEQCSIR